MEFVVRSEIFEVVQDIARVCASDRGHFGFEPIVLHALCRGDTLTRLVAKHSLDQVLGLL